VCKRDITCNEKSLEGHIDHEQKEKLLDEVFDEYGDNPIPEE